MSQLPLIFVCSALRRRCTVVCLHWDGPFVWTKGPLLTHPGLFSPLPPCSEQRLWWQSQGKRRNKAQETSSWNCLHTHTHTHTLLTWRAPFAAPLECRPSKTRLNPKKKRQLLLKPPSNKRWGGQTASFKLKTLVQIVHSCCMNYWIK